MLKYKYSLSYTKVISYIKLTYCFICLNLSFVTGFFFVIIDHYISFHLHVQFTSKNVKNAEKTSSFYQISIEQLKATLEIIKINLHFIQIFSHTKLNQTKQIFSTSLHVLYMKQFHNSSFFSYQLNIPEYSSMPNSTPTSKNKGYS